MPKRKGRRAYLKRFSAGYVKVSRAVDHRVAHYYNSVNTLTGPKDKSEPVLENSFTRPIVNGVPGKFVCSECGVSFHTTVSWDQHLKKFTAKQALEHMPVFVPDIKRGHYDVEDGTYHPHRMIPTPLKDNQTQLRIWQSKTRQGFDEFRWFEVVRNSKFQTTLYLGSCGAVWQFKREYASGQTTEYSLEYSSKEEAMNAFDVGFIRWKKASAP